MPFHRDIWPGSYQDLGIQANKYNFGVEQGSAVSLLETALVAGAPLALLPAREVRVGGFPAALHIST